METEKPSSFGALVRHYRRLRDWSQEEVADKAGLRLRTLNDLERDGVHLPRKDTVVRLARVLGLSPVESTAFAAEARRLRARDFPSGRADQSIGTSSHLSIPPLPVPTTRLLGRERELAEVPALLRQDDVRLVTLTGAGGSGKTRLALGVAHYLQDSFPDGVAFVPLAPLADSELVLSTIAQDLGLRDVPGQSWPVTFRARLRNRRLLVVVDNFEQLLPAAPHLVDLLGGCPGLKLLVTSRAALRLSMEQEYPVLPLEVPDPRLHEPLDRVAQYPSVALFAARARAVQPAFRVTKSTSPAIADICRRLDGLPLAIELAAARIRLLDPEAMLARLERRLPLLTGGARDLPERQRTLRATLDWSHALLAPTEQTLFARLAVFAGSFTLDAAEAVCASDGAIGHPKEGVLDGLETLMTQSLVQRVGSVKGEARFTMLETMREYALEKLAEGGEAEAIRHTHVHYYVALAERAELGSPEDDSPYHRLDLDLDNLREALGRASHGQDEQLGLRLAAALPTFWQVRSRLSEGRYWLEQLLPGREIAPLALQAKALRAAAHVRYLQGDLPGSMLLLEEALSIYRALGDKPGTAATLNTMANVASTRGDYRSATALYQESLALYRHIADRSGILKSLLNQTSNANTAADPEGAERTLAEFWELAGRLTDYVPSPSLTLEESAIAFNRGNDARAVELGERAAAQAQGVGYKGVAAISLHVVGSALNRSGDHATARERHRESVRLSWEDGSRSVLTMALIGLAAATAPIDPVRAASLYGAAEALRSVFGIQVYACDLLSYDRGVSSTRAALPHPEFETAWAEGRAMTLEQAVEYALKEQGMHDWRLLGQARISYGDT